MSSLVPRSTPALLRIGDLVDDEIDDLLSRAHALQHGSAPVERCRDRVVGLLFLETSLRTRVGFAAAASRLGASFVEVFGQRSSATSMPESLTDTMRTVASYVDVVVARPGVSLWDADLRAAASAGGAVLVNGGDSGPEAEHPTQALVDLAAMRLSTVALSDAHVAVCGDLRMRAVRSLLRLLARRPPRALTLMTPQAFQGGDDVPLALKDVVKYGTLVDVADVDVLYVAGMPLDCFPASDRERLIVDELTVSRLPSHAIVLSPMPVIDEITPSARIDPRICIHEQSELGLYVRMAVLEHCFAIRWPHEQSADS